MSINKLIKVCAALLAACTTTTGAAKEKVVDFNYPQDVSKFALEDLQTALQKRDGEGTVDALVRYSIAQSSISQENMPKIINLLDSTIEVEQRVPYRALLQHFEAIIYNRYYEEFIPSDRVNPAGDPPADYTEWDRAQFYARVRSLIEASLSSPQELRAVGVTSLPTIIECNELGATYIPTLHEFLAGQGIDLLNSLDHDDEATALVKRIHKQWIDNTQGDIPANLYARLENGESHQALYNEFASNEHCGLILTRGLDNRDLTDKDLYKIYNDYQARFPKSVYHNDVANLITRLEDKNVNITYPDVITSTDSLVVDVDVRNVNAYSIDIYRLSEKDAIAYRKDRKYYTYSLKQLTLVAHHDLTQEGSVPFKLDNVKKTFAPLPYGYYIIVPSFKHDGKTQTTRSLDSNDLLCVTDMAVMGVSYPNNGGRMGVVDMRTGEPLKGVELVGNQGGITGDDGFITLKGDRVSLRPQRGDDHYATATTYNQLSNRERNNTSVQIFTDLGVYRPGETIHWALVLSQVGTSIHATMPNEPLEVILEDFNGKNIDTVKVTTDEFGRASGKFEIPTDRLNGQFDINVYRMKSEKKRDYVGEKSVNVSEYKTPTFVVSIDKDHRAYVVGEPVKVTGHVETYSGVPLGNKEVKISLTKSHWRWAWFFFEDNHVTNLTDTTVTTDASGNFTVEFPAELFPENAPGLRYRWCRNVYGVTARVTDEAGESHEARQSFIVGSRSGLTVDRSTTIHRNNAPIKLPITFNTTDENVTSAPCSFTIIDKATEKTVLTGNLDALSPTVDLQSLPSGDYTVKVHLLASNAAINDDDDEGYNDGTDCEFQLILYRDNDKHAPVADSPLWIAEPSNSVDDKNVAHITVGTSTPLSHIYYVASVGSTVIDEGWLHYKPGMHKLDLRVPHQQEQDLRVEFITCYKRKFVNEVVVMRIPANHDSLKLRATSFRDKLVPGDREHWTFTIDRVNNATLPAAMMLSMTDEAINSIASNVWNFGESWPRITTPHIFNNNIIGINQQWSGFSGKQLRTANIEYPSFNLYDNEPFSVVSRRGRIFFNRSLTRASAKMAAPMAVNKIAVTSESADFSASMDDMVMEESVALGAAARDNTQSNAALDNITVREADVKTALWQPMLTSDASGNVSLEFDVPNFNTTWLVQAIAYNKEVHTTNFVERVLTQKPIMVRSSLPRFLRQGDKAQLAATLQNATDEATTIDAVIELFDPRTGEIIATRNFTEHVDAQSTRAVSIDWTVPDSTAFVGFRIKGASGQYGDGEQVMLPVLTTIQPVIETKPFYLEAGTNHHEVTLPKFAKDARVTVEYCDNPVWYCVLALPTIFSDNYITSTAMAHSLFALDVAQGVAHSAPEIREAVMYWKQHDEDSALVSMLERNKDLKINTLLQSPWLRDADRQTLRMQCLDELFDPEKTAKNRENIITHLAQLQNSDGGFSWINCPPRHSSVWATGEILELVGEINHLGYGSGDKRLQEMIDRAIDYYDREQLKMLRDMLKYDKDPYFHFNDYAYIRTLHPQHALPKANKDMLNKVLNAMEKQWQRRGITLRKKAYFAMTLERNNRHSAAASLIESIRQFSITKPELGTYWESPTERWSWVDPVAVTSTILQAINEVDAKPGEVDGVRKWMLLMKQTNDWGSCSLAADAVYSLLRTGTQWLGVNPKPRVTIGGVELVPTQQTHYLGYMRAQIAPTTTGTLTIDRQGNGPAWGAIYMQFSAPMIEVKAVAIDEISVEKSYLVYGPDGSLAPATTLKVGDKVQVRTTIHTNRDMDFVTLIDERAACFEPVDQLSGYDRADNTWFYRETRDSQSRIFFTGLSRGTHVISYDVNVTAPGTYTAGIATIQCQYAPQMTAHSAGFSLHVTPAQ